MDFHHLLARLHAATGKYASEDSELRELRDLLEHAVSRVPTVRTAEERSTEDLPTPLSPGETESRYRDCGLIGRGGFSEVREVWDRHVGRRVARKEQLASRTSPLDFARFREEVRITARLQHPGVVPLYDWGTLPDGRVWFTMKRVQGDTIGRRILALHATAGEERTRALRRLVDDFRRLCEPVAFAHAQRVIHRDLTPQNLMVGEFGEVHVMDWGLARDLGRSRASDGERAGATEPGYEDVSETDVRTRVAGTPMYMPPEQAYGDIAAMGPESDVYALGAVLYEILSGHPPYVRGESDSSAPERILDRVRRGPPAPIEEVAPREAPKELCAVCRKAMQRAPSQRHEDAGALMEALRDWLEGANRRARALGIVEEANREHLPNVLKMRQEADALRVESRKILDRLRSFDRAQDKAVGWRLADRAAGLEQEAVRAEITWTQKLRSALNEAPDLTEAHSVLADHYAKSLLRAERAHDAPAATSFAVLLEEHAQRLDGNGRTSYEALLRGDGRLTLLTNPPGARVMIRPYAPVHRYLMTNDALTRTLMAPVIDLSLPRGSYLVTLEAAGFREVRYPICIGRDEHWDAVRPKGNVPQAVRLLHDQDLMDDDVYISAGWFWAGGDPHAGESLVGKRVWADSFVIRKHPVTNGEYVEFLNALVEEGRVEEAQRYCPAQAPGATLKDEELWAYLFDFGSRRFRMTDPETQHALPVVFVDWSGAMAYADYWSRRTGHRWRLPSELEWEKAARGVDGRFMPWGDQVEPTWACVSGSHPRRKQRMTVHDYPTDVSPYGVRGMAGNVRDWCVERWQLEGPRLDNDILQVDVASPEDPSERPMRGGAWISVGDLARLAVRYSERPNRRHGVLGFRLARSIDG